MVKVILFEMVTKVSFFFYFRVAVEPLYPQVCQRVPVLISTKEEQGPSPIDLSRSLNSAACSLSVRREDPIAIFHLVMEVRSNLLFLNKLLLK